MNHINMKFTNVKVMAQHLLSVHLQSPQPGGLLFLPLENISVRRLQSGAQIVA